MKVMCKSSVIIFFLCILCQANAQDWHYDFEEAKIEAATQNHNIMLLFTGSDWCPPCIKLERKILSQQQFIDFTAENFILLKADFPKRKKNRLSKTQEEKNFKLASRYNKKMAFPIILVLDTDGNVLGVTGYRKMSVERYISLLTSFKGR